MRITAAEFQERRERLLEHVRRDGLSGYVLFGADSIQYFTGFWFLSNERPVIYAESAGGESAIFVPEFEVERTRAETDFARIESYPEYPGIEHPMLILARVARRPRDPRRDRRGQRRLPRHPRLPGAAAERGHGRVGRAARRPDRELHAAQERCRDRAHPRERALVRARAPAAAGVLAARRDRGRGEPPGERGGDAGDARRARRRRRDVVLLRRVRRLPRADRAAQLVGARGRAQHRVPSRATCS